MVAVVMVALWLAADNPADSIALDRDGRRGLVAFDHALHVKVGRDPRSAHPVSATATCPACHHTRDAKGVIQLSKCEACHGPEGDSRNPKSAAFNEENRKRAYHELCIGCHADVAKASGESNAVVRTGPVACVDCHTGAPRPKD